MKRCLMLVEGQTEERFVKDVLCPEFEPRGVYLFPTILTTKVVKSGPNFKGGVTNYAKLRAEPPSFWQSLEDWHPKRLTRITKQPLPND